MTSPGGDGKTLTAINLAGALARGSDTRVLLIEADLRRPTLAKQFGIRGQRHRASPTSCSTRAARRSTDAVRRLDFGFSVITAGSIAAAGPRSLQLASTRTRCSARRASSTTTSCSTRRRSSRCPTAVCSRRGSTACCSSSPPHKTPRKLLEEALNLLDAVERARHRLQWRRPPAGRLSPSPLLPRATLPGT